MIEIKPLPEDYKHPQGWDVRGHYGIYENGRVIATGKTEQELRDLLPQDQEAA